MQTLSASAPGRVELLGNHTDYNEGFVLSAAIDRSVVVEGEASGDRSITIASNLAPTPVHASLDRLVPLEDPDAWANYVLGVVHTLRQENYPVGGFHLRIAGDLPAGAGLSSSAALEVATARFLTKAFGLDIAPLKLAKLCRRAENGFVGVKCGLLDQVTSLFGQENHAVYLDCRSEQVQNVPLPERTALLVFHCGLPHRLADGEYNERRVFCLSATRELGVAALRDVDMPTLLAARPHLDPRAYRCALHVVGENERVLLGVDRLRRGDRSGFGQLMFASHESSRRYFRNSTPELDVLVALASQQKGVFGSRLTGGGFGGATISLVEQSLAEQIAANLQKGYTERTGHVGKVYPCTSAAGVR